MDIKWIFAENSQPYDWYVFEKKFSEDNTDGIFADVSALGRYFLYVNGKLASYGPVKSYYFNRKFDRVDISGFLRKGENTISVLSQHIEYGGIYFRAHRNGAEIFSSDKTWRTKQFDALDFCTSAHCPPLEPIPLNEEWFDARTASAFNMESDTQSPVYVNSRFNRISQNAVGFSDGEPAYPVACLGSSCSRESTGFGFRFKNRARKYNKASKCSSEVYLCLLSSEKEQTVKISGHNYQKCSLNGKPFGDTITLKKGDNLFACCYYGAYFEPEFIIYGATGLEFSQIPFVQEECTALVAASDTNELCFSWAYPQINPHLFTDNEKTIDIIMNSHSITDIIKSCGDIFKKALICDISAYLNIKETVEKYITEPENTPFEAIAFRGNKALYYDFGTETLGFAEFTVTAPAGTAIEIACFEIIDEGGVHFDNAGVFRYICLDGTQTYRAFNPRGMRYICLSVSGNPESFTLKSLCIIRSSAVKSPVGSFVSDDEALNKIYDMSISTARECMADTYVDCPGREQVYWLWDAKITSEVNYYNFGLYDYDHQCLEIVSESLGEDYKSIYRRGNKYYLEDKYLATAAFGNYVYGGLPMSSFIWGLHIIDGYLYSGDSDYIKSMYPILKKMLSNSENMLSSRGLFAGEGVWNLIEWGENDLLPCCELTANSALMALCFLQTSKLASELGDEEYSQKCRERFLKLRDAINKYCWDEKRQAYVDTVRDEYGYDLYVKFFSENHIPYLDYDEFVRYTRISEQTNTLAYLCDCVPSNREESVCKIITSVNDKDYSHKFAFPNDNAKNPGRIDELVRSGTPFFLYFTFKALAKMGKHDIILDVLKRDYGLMLEKGSTTCWETFFNPNTTANTHSICHGWSASPAVYLQSEICGIKPLKPGFAEFSFQPHLGSLRYIKSQIATPHGVITVEIDKDKNLCKVDYPEQCTLIKA